MNAVRLAPAILAALVAAAALHAADAAVPAADEILPREGVRQQPRVRGTAKSAKRVAIPIEQADISRETELAAMKAAIVPDKGLVEQWVIPRDWFEPFVAAPSSGLLEADFYVESDDDIVIFPNEDSGYESCCFEPSWGSWYSGEFTVPGIENAAEVVISFAVSRANAWPASKPVTPELQARMTPIDFPDASVVKTLGPTVAKVPNKDKATWYSFSMFPANGADWEDYYIDFAVLGFDPYGSANIGWKIKDDIVLTVYH